jgi:hypothetical protein
MIVNALSLDASADTGGQNPPIAANFTVTGFRAAGP